MVEDLEEKGRENEEPAIDHSDDNYTQATSISGEMENSSNQAETSSELEGTIGNKNHSQCDIKSTDLLLVTVWWHD